MPNWCENDLTITGPKEDLDKCLESVKSDNSNFSFDKIIPMPPSLRITSPASTIEERHQAEANVASFGYPDWYEWSINTWGTKWDTDNADIEREENQAVVHFSTAWSPPCPAIKSLSGQFPNLIFELEFFEQGAAYQGRCLYARGVEAEASSNYYDGERGG